jgi:glutathione S-transferase
MLRGIQRLQPLTESRPTRSIILETIGPSHFCEVVRWTLDRSRVKYTEERDVGILGLWTNGRSVPRLRVEQGVDKSVISGTSEILRFLYGDCLAEQGAELTSYLCPSQESMALELRMQSYGKALQMFVYYYALDSRAATLHLWGVSDPSVPVWQRVALTIFGPVLIFLMRRIFPKSKEAYARALSTMDGLLSDTEVLFRSGRTTLLATSKLSAWDMQFAAMSALWATPPEFVERDHVPKSLLQAKSYMPLYVDA